MSAEFAVALLGWLAVLVPSAIFLAVVVLLICIGKMAAGQRMRWPWRR